MPGHAITLDPVAGLTGTSSLPVAARAAVVLFLDPDAAVRDAVAAALDAHGMSVRVFAHAAPFLALELPAGPVCVVADHHLPPEGGLAVLRTLQGRAHAAAMVLTCGGLRPGLDTRVVQLLKPFGQDQLVRAIERAFAARACNGDT